MQIPTRFSRFRHDFPNPDKIFQIPVTFFFQILMIFFTPTIDRTDWRSPSLETDSTDFSSGQFWVPPPDASESSLGWAQNQPGPTRGQP